MASVVHKIVPATRVRLVLTGPATKPRARRYEHDARGGLVHVDIKTLGHVPGGRGHEVRGRAKRVTGPAVGDRLLVHLQRAR